MGKKVASFLFITSGVLFVNGAAAEISAVQGVSNAQEMPIHDFNIEVIDWFVSAEQEQLQEICLYKSDNWEVRPEMTAENALVCAQGADIMGVDETGAGKVTLTVPESQLTVNETFYLFATARDGHNTNFEYSPSAGWAWFKAVASEQEEGKESADFNYDTSVSGLTKQKSAADSSPIVKNSGNTLKTGGYLSDWAQYERKFQLSDIAPSSYDEVIYSFFGICGDRATAGGTVGSTEKSKLVQLSCESLGKPEGAVVSLDHWGSFQTAGAFDPGYQHSDLYEGQLTQEKWQRLNADNVRGLFGELIKLKRENTQVDIGLSIGGWTLSEPYHRVAASPELSQNFANSLIELLDKFTVGNRPLFTSLDIDWEFPGHGGESGAFTPEDGDNFVALLRVLRNTLDDNDYQDIQISSAVGATTAYIEAIGRDNYKALGGSDGLLDKIYLMNYDYWGSFDIGLGHQSNLFGQSVIASSLTGVNSADKAIKLLTSYGVDKSKIMLGVANYARGKQGKLLVDGKPFEATDITKTNVFGTHEDTVVEGYDLFGNMAGQDLRGDNGFNLYTDYDNNADYYYNKNTGVYYSIDTPRTAAMKAKYAKDNGLRGTFVWTIEQDYKGITIDSMNQAYGNELLGSNSFSPTQIQSFTETCGVNLTHTECTALLSQGGPTVYLYEDGDFGGYEIPLFEGEYTQSELMALGMHNDDLSSIRVREGYTARIYENGDFSGWSKEFTQDTPWVGDFENNKTSSIKIMKNNTLTKVKLIAGESLKPVGGEVVKVKVQETDGLVHDISVPLSEYWTRSYRWPMAVAKAINAVGIENVQAGEMNSAGNVSPIASAWRNFVYAPNGTSVSIELSSVTKVKTIVGGELNPVGGDIIEVKVQKADGVIHDISVPVSEYWTRSYRWPMAVAKAINAAGIENVQAGEMNSAGNVSPIASAWRNFVYAPNGTSVSLALK
ncbi:glycosyl hydrolase family 18 protein [Vibrio sp. 10N.261.52.A1]|uniref:glycosyl hydrolase family 18 protein n=1 Tax=Vibrio TaxID=662 RepID=UPI0018E496FE|nr:glycosyl hydrolase family 18 protein [Vibrio sp. 10N.261.52.A1]